MSDKETVLYQKKESVAVVTLCRPDTKNAINMQLIVELKDIVQEIRDDKDIRVVIITGSGKEVFCAGTDREELVSVNDKREVIDRFSITPVIQRFERPTIAGINGDALGQGLELALACDVRVCDENARFAMNHIAYGDIPWDGGTQRLSRLVGRSKAIEMILSGDMIDAREAYRIGLIAQIAPSGNLLSTALDMAHEMASKGPVAVQYAKEAVYKGMDLTLEQGLRLEADLYFLLHTTRDRTEGITAFREKRSPRFEGH